MSCHRDVGASKVALRSRQGADIEISAREDSMVLLLPGRPLDEPIEACGPFVINSRAEIQQPMDDYRKGKMGVL